MNNDLAPSGQIMPTVLPIVDFKFEHEYKSCKKPTIETPGTHVYRQTCEQSHHVSPEVSRYCFDSSVIER